jgi:hypothetical protein
VIWELWENGQYVELSALGRALHPRALRPGDDRPVDGKKFGVKE